MNKLFTATIFVVGLITGIAIANSFSEAHATTDSAAEHRKDRQQERLIAAEEKQTAILNEQKRAMEKQVRVLDEQKRVMEKQVRALDSIADTLRDIQRSMK